MGRITSPSTGPGGFHHHAKFIAQSRTLPAHTLLSLQSHFGAEGPPKSGDTRAGHVLLGDTDELDAFRMVVRRAVGQAQVWSVAFSQIGISLYKITA